MKEISMITVLDEILDNASVSLFPFKSSMSPNWHCSCCDKTVCKESGNIIELESNNHDQDLNELVQIKYCSS